LRVASSSDHAACTVAAHATYPKSGRAAVLGGPFAQAVTARGAGSGPRPDFIGELVGVPWAFGVVPVSHRLDRRSLSLARACLAAA
jgi:hypothetical protein